MTDREIIALALAELNDDELAPIASMAFRMFRGRREYGPLDLLTDARDFEAEELEEDLDRCAYRTLRLRRRRLLAERLPKADT